MSREFTPFSEFRIWVNLIKEQNIGRTLRTVVNINNTEQKNLAWNESCVSVEISNFCIVWYFKARDTHKQRDTKSPFEIMVLEILDLLKNVLAEFVVHYKSKKHYRLTEHPDFEFIEEVKKRNLAVRFIGMGSI